MAYAAARLQLPLTQQWVMTACEAWRGLLQREQQQCQLADSRMR